MTTNHSSLQSAEKATPEQREEARRLLEQAGAPDLARQATGESRQPQPETTQRREDFARSWGFTSYLEMFEASKPVSTEGERDWLVTNAGPEKWILWNDEDLQADATYTTLEEAMSNYSQSTPYPQSTPSSEANPAPPTG